MISAIPGGSAIKDYNMSDPLLGTMEGVERREIGGVQIEVVRTGAARVKRVIYPPGFRWSTHMKPIVATDFCMHAHVGFLARGEVHVHTPMAASWSA